MTVRLNGPNNNEGRVEVYHNGEWGTVCDNGWDFNDAEVVCKELGLGSVFALVNRGSYGQGIGQIWLNELNCNGTEVTIADCAHRGWGDHDCEHSQDAGVICTGSNGMLIICLILYVYIQHTTWCIHCLHIFKMILKICNFKKGIGVESQKLCKYVKDKKYGNKLKMNLNSCYCI